MQTTTPLGRLQVLKAIAGELFDSVTLESESDPEIADLNTVVFHVVAHGDVTEVAARRMEWHRRTQVVLGEECERVQLVIDLQP